MSISSGLSFFSKVKSELKSLFAHAPGWESSAAATLTYLAPMVESVVMLADPAASSAVNASISRVQAAMAAASVIIKEAGSAPTLVRYLNAINDNAAELESVSGIKDPATVNKLNVIVGTITAEINAILGEVSGNVATA